MEIKGADVAESVDARDLKSLRGTDHNIDIAEQNRYSAKHSRIYSPAGNDTDPAHLQNAFSVNRVRARGKRYAYIRGTDVALVRGFVGSDAGFDAAIASALNAHVHRANAQIEGWRNDAAKSLHKVTAARAARRRLAYSLSNTDIFDMLSLAADRCALTGLLFDYKPNRNADWRRRPMAPSLDRIDNKLGYEPDNIRLVCVCVNIAINEWGIENFALICRSFTEKSR